MKSFSFAFYNIRSLTKNFSEFKTFLLQKKYDIVGISETWLTNSFSCNLLKIDGYKFIHKDRPSRGGGVGIYLRSDWKYKILKESISEYLEEIWLKIFINKKTYIFGALYRPPAGSFSDFLENLEDTLSDFLPICSEIICGGDINLDLLSESQNARKFENALECFKLKQIISSPTRLTKSTSTLLDVIIVPINDNYTFGVENVFNISDHLLVFGQYSINQVKNSSISVKVRNLKGVDKNHITELLKITPLEDIFYINDINRKVVHFTKLIVDLFDFIAPIKNIRKHKFNPPWFTDTVKEMVSLKEKAFNRFKKTGRKNDWEYYKQLKNETTNAISREKKAYMEFCLTNYKGNGKMLWKKIADLDIHNKKCKEPIPNALNIPNNINNYFLQFSNYSVPDPDVINSYLSSLKINSEYSFSFSLVDENIVFKHLSELKSKALGHDKLSLEMLLLCCPYILPYLVNIINTCLLESVFPESWKVSKVIPLPKKSDVSDYNDLRPISILSPLSKILEKIMAVQIREYINSNKILPDRQSGFRKGYSCATCLLEVVDDIIKEIDLGKCSVLLLLDYSKAFDKINHEILVAILYHIGFADNSLSLIKSYLTHRLQYVETTVGVSEQGSIYCGVPQGSVLGPLLFCIYTFNIVNSLKYCSSYLYADDSQLLYSFLPSDSHEANIVINEDLNSLLKFSEQHHLSINPDKSQFLIFGKEKIAIARSVKIYVDNVELKSVSSARDLGLVIDTDLRFTQHVNKCIGKAYSNLKMLYPHRHILSENLKTKLTDALVLSHFNFCDVVYGPCLKRIDQQRIQRVQKSCLRYIYGVRKFQPISHKLDTAKWIDMESRRRLHAACLYHTIILYKHPPYLYNKITFRSDVHNLNLRFRGLISPPPHRTAQYQRCFTYNIYFIYNEIPSELKSLNVTKFKKLYKNVLTRRT